MATDTACSKVSKVGEIALRLFGSRAVFVTTYIGAEQKCTTTLHISGASTHQIFLDLIRTINSDTHAYGGGNEGDLALISNNSNNGEYIITLRF